MPHENLEATVKPIWCTSPIHPQATARRPVRTPPIACANGQQMSPTDCRKSTYNASDGLLRTESEGEQRAAGGPCGDT